MLVDQDDIDSRIARIQNDISILYSDYVKEAIRQHVKPLKPDAFLLCIASEQSPFQAPGVRHDINVESGKFEAVGAVQTAPNYNDNDPKAPSQMIYGEVSGRAADSIVRDGGYIQAAFQHLMLQTGLSTVASKGFSVLAQARFGIEDYPEQKKIAEELSKKVKKTKKDVA